MSEYAPQMATPLIDPRVLSLWRLAERLAQDVAAVRVLRARDAPAWPHDGGRWDEAAPHQHAVPTLVACLAGVVRIETARGRIDLRDREVCVVAPAAWHVHAPLRPGSVAYGQGLVFDRSDVLLSDHAGAITAQIPAAPVRDLLGQLVHQPDPALVRRLIAAVTGGMVHAFAMHPAVSRMAHRLWAGSHLGITAADILMASGLGARQAHRLFCAWFGTTPKQALLDQRLALAEALLAEGSTVTAAACASGFPDRRSLSRLRRRRKGTATA